MDEYIDRLILCIIGANSIVIYWSLRSIYHVLLDIVKELKKLGTQQLKYGTKDNIKPPTLKEILVEEFLLPSLAETLRMDISDLQDILTGKQELTHDVAIKLSRYVGMSDDYFYKIQEEIIKRI